MTGYYVTSFRPFEPFGQTLLTDQKCGSGLAESEKKTNKIGFLLGNIPNIKQGANVSPRNLKHCKLNQNINSNSPSNESWR